MALGHIHSVEDLLAIARAVAERSAERYAELAEAFEVSCNPDTSAAFRELAEAGRRRLEELPATATAAAVPWGNDEPVIADPDQVHYLMLPWHAFDLALRHEKRTMDLFADIAARSPNPGIKVAAHGLAERSFAHAEHVQTRRDAMPEPHAGWDEDPDPPNWDM